MVSGDVVWFRSSRAGSRRGIACLPVCVGGGGDEREERRWDEMRGEERGGGEEGRGRVGEREREGLRESSRPFFWVWVRAYLGANMVWIVCVMHWTPSAVSGNQDM